LLLFFNRKGLTLREIKYIKPGLSIGSCIGFRINPA
jgi:hypothetical protein